MNWAQAVVVVRVVRQPALDEAYLVHAHIVGRVVENAAASTPVADLVDVLRTAPEFDDVWTDELSTLVRRHRHDRMVATVEQHRDRIARIVARSTGVPDALAMLTADSELAGLDAPHIGQALALSPCPPGAQPEHFETPGGDTLVWPPHPLQARTVEPVTDDDYAGLARTVDGVRRAWVVVGRLPGIDWQGAATTGGAADPGALTILVEREAGAASSGNTFLREVLYTALGSTDPGWSPVFTQRFGIDAPWEFFEGPATSQVPRRVMCDEIGVAVLAECDIVVRGVVHVPAAANHALVLDRIYAAIAAFLVDGRPESVGSGAVDDIANAPGGDRRSLATRPRAADRLEPR